MAKELLPLHLKMFKRELLHDFRTLLFEHASLRTPDEYLRAQAVCRMFKISPTALRSLRQQHKLPFMKMGRMVYFHIDDLRRVFDSTKQQ